MITVSRWVLLVFWCLVLWGTFWDLSVLYRLATLGWSAAAEVVMETPPERVAAAWGNRACGLLAAFVWVVLPLARWSRTREAA